MFKIKKRRESDRDPYSYSSSSSSVWEGKHNFYKKKASMSAVYYDRTTPPQPPPTTERTIPLPWNEKDLYHEEGTLQTRSISPTHSPSNSAVGNFASVDESSDRDRLQPPRQSSSAANIQICSIATGAFNEYEGSISFDTIPEEVTVRQQQQARPHRPLPVLPVAGTRTDPSLSPFPSGEPLSASGLLEDVYNGDVEGKMLYSHEGYYENKENIRFLRTGGALFSLACKPTLTDYDCQMLDTMVNLSSYPDETRDNFVPYYDVHKERHQKNYAYMLQKAAYLLPGITLDEIKPEVVSSIEYHEACQPKGTFVWKDCPETEFRITKPVIKFVYTIIVQFKVSTIDDPQVLRSLSDCMGVRVDKVVLMERTKRSKNPKQDATAKCKSVLMYTKVPEGVLVTHCTLILNTKIPTVVAKIVDNFGVMGLKEACETAKSTRQYLLGLQRKQEEESMYR